MLDRIPLGDVDKAKIELLVSESVSEGRALEFKAALPGGKDTEKREFCADVSAFANAGGGTIVYGVGEDRGAAKEAPGLAVDDPDAAVRRLQDLLMTGVDPRIAGVEFRVIPGFPLGAVIVLRVPRSWSAPHMVIASGDSRFFARSGARKEPLDVRQIRAAFAASAELPDRLRRLRDERLGRILGDDTPALLASPRRVILHLVPLSAMDPFTSVDVTEKAYEQRSSLGPIGSGGWSHRFNFDGFLTLDQARRERPARGYVQVMRRGVFEAVSTLTNGPGDEHLTIPGVAFPRDVIDAVVKYGAALAELKLEPPFVVLISLVGVRGMSVYMSPRYSSGDEGPIDRDVLLLPEATFNTYPSDREAVISALRPAFDALWQASGFGGFFQPER